jgi:hypothetical protein
MRASLVNSICISVMGIRDTGVEYCTLGMPFWLFMDIRFVSSSSLCFKERLPKSRRQNQLIVDVSGKVFTSSERPFETLLAGGSPSPSCEGGFWTTLWFQHLLTWRHSWQR